MLDSFQNLQSILDELIEKCDQSRVNESVALERVRLAEERVNTLHNEIVAGVRAREADIQQLQARKNLTKDDVLALIKEEYDTVKESCESRVRHLEADLSSLQSKILLRDEEINILKQKIKHREMPSEDKCVQFCIQDVLDLPVVGDTELYYT